jgi:hypothetical protein
MPQRPATFTFRGGLDTNSAALAVDPGRLIAGMNYEPLAEGYGRVQGFERFDGKQAPSAVSFWLLDFDQGNQVIEQGDVIVGATSGAVATVIEPPIAFNGSWGAGTASGTLLLIGLTGGAFQNNEILNIGGVPSALVDGLAVENSASTEAFITSYKEKAQAWQRALIGKVPGEGPVRGVAVHDGTVYAWRDAVGGAKADLFRATATGWLQSPQVWRMPFTLGTSEITEGATITGATSGATATVHRLRLDEGTWAGGDAIGALWLTSVTGGFINGEILRIGGVNRATGGAIAAQSFPAGGRYRTLSHNFYGAANLFRLYGVNGVGKAFELKGHVPVFLDTGMAIDTPTRIFEIGNHLGLVFPGGSLQFSGTADPLAWAVVLGAGEIGFGTEVTDVVQANETAVAVFGEQKISTLTGSDVNNFVLDPLTTEAGADPDSAQRIARTIYIDKRGLRDLTATQAFGNFKAGALSGRFERYFKVKRKAGARVVGSFLSRTKSQYRMVWDDGTGLAVYMGGREPEAIPFEFDDMRPFCFGQGELDDGEGIFIGAEDGYVYRIDSGTNFDGTRIRGFCMMPFNHFGNPMLEERYHWVALELDAPARATIGITVQFDYAEGHQPISGERDFTVIGSAGNSSFLVQGGGGNWNSDAWNQFYWSAPIEGTATATIDGVGRNASFVFATYAGLTEEPHVLQAYSVSRSPRKMRRI